MRASSSGVARASRRPSRIDGLLDGLAAVLEHGLAHQPIQALDRAFIEGDADPRLGHSMMIYHTQISATPGTS